jgi:hypothetical protein
LTKPDVGLRGSGVKKINTLEDLEQYALKANFDFVVQEFRLKMKWVYFMFGIPMKR